MLLTLLLLGVGVAGLRLLQIKSVLVTPKIGEQNQILQSVKQAINSQAQRLLKDTDPTNQGLTLTNLGQFETAINSALQTLHYVDPGVGNPAGPTSGNVTVTTSNYSLLNSNYAFYSPVNTVSVPATILPPLYNPNPNLTIESASATGAILTFNVSIASATWTNNYLASILVAQYPICDVCLSPSWPTTYAITGNQTLLSTSDNQLDNAGTTLNVISGNFTPSTFVSSPQVTLAHLMPYYSVASGVTNATAYAAAGPVLQNLLYNPASYQQYSWTDSTTTPAGAPVWMTTETDWGFTRLEVDLSQVPSGVLYITGGAATYGLGVILDGSATNTGGAVIVATDGLKIFIRGNNARPVYVIGGTNVTNPLSTNLAYINPAVTASNAIITTNGPITGPQQNTTWVGGIYGAELVTLHPSGPCNFSLQGFWRMYPGPSDFSSTQRAYLNLSLSTLSAAQRLQFEPYLLRDVWLNVRLDKE